MENALRIADELDAVPENGADPDLIQEAAAELRRLHALNQELLEALEFCAGTSYITYANEAAQEALEKAKGGRQ